VAPQEIPTMMPRAGTVRTVLLPRGGAV